MCVYTQRKVANLLINVTWQIISKNHGEISFGMDV